MPLGPPIDDFGNSGQPFGGEGGFGPVGPGATPGSETVTTGVPNFPSTAEGARMFLNIGLAKRRIRDRVADIFGPDSEEAKTWSVFTTAARFGPWEIPDSLLSNPGDRDRLESIRAQIGRSGPTDYFRLLGNIGPTGALSPFGIDQFDFGFGSENGVFQLPGLGEIFLPDLRQGETAAAAPPGLENFGRSLEDIFFREDKNTTDVPFGFFGSILPGVSGGGETGPVIFDENGNIDFKKSIEKILGGNSDEDSEGGFSVTVKIPGIERPIRITFPGQTDLGDIFEVVRDGVFGSGAPPPSGQPGTEDPGPGTEPGEDTPPEGVDPDDPIDIGVPLPTPGGDSDAPPPPVDTGASPPIDPIDLGIPPAGPATDVLQTRPAAGTRLIGPLNRDFMSEILKIQQAQQPGFVIPPALLAPRS